MLWQNSFSLIVILIIKSLYDSWPVHFQFKMLVSSVQTECGCSQFSCFPFYKILRNFELLTVQPFSAVSLSVTVPEVRLILEYHLWHQYCLNVFSKPYMF
jgi:hypothetical protein